jgi:hypothetical protein
MAFERGSVQRDRKGFPRDSVWLTNVFIADLTQESFCHIDMSLLDG